MYFTLLGYAHRFSGADEWFFGAWLYESRWTHTWPKKLLEKLSEKENLEKSQEKLIKQLLENQSKKQDV